MKFNLYLKDFDDKKPPVKDPIIKLEPIMKLIGKSTVLLINKLTLLLFELFWMPTINKVNRQKLKIVETNKFLI